MATLRRNQPGAVYIYDDPRTLLAQIRVLRIPYLKTTTSQPVESRFWLNQNFRSRLILRFQAQFRIDCSLSNLTSSTSNPIFYADLALVLEDLLNVTSGEYYMGVCVLELIIRCNLNLIVDYFYLAFCVEH